jgi:hypothetical protein
LLGKKRSKSTATCKITLISQVAITLNKFFAVNLKHEVNGTFSNIQ